MLNSTTMMMKQYIITTMLANDYSEEFFKNVLLLLSKVLSCNQKSMSQIFDICFKNISFSPGFELPEVSGAGREVFHSVHFHQFLFNLDLKNQTLSNLSSLEN